MAWESSDGRLVIAQELLQRGLLLRIADENELVADLKAVVG